MKVSTESVFCCKPTVYLAIVTAIANGSLALAWLEANPVRMKVNAQGFEATAPAKPNKGRTLMSTNPSE